MDFHVRIRNTLASVFRGARAVLGFIAGIVLRILDGVLVILQIFK